jgi:hypothetical protein
VDGPKSGIVKRLEIRIAEGRRMSRDSFNTVSPSSTEFKDIEAYGKLLEERYNSYLRFNNNKSVTSAKTV